MRRGQVVLVEEVARIMVGQQIVQYLGFIACLRPNQSLPKGTQRVRKPQGDLQFHHELTKIVNSAESELTP